MDKLNTIALPWQSVPQSLPPDPHCGGFSPDVWLALSDGTVHSGQCLHKKPDANYDAPVHDWFIENRQLDVGLKVIAWMPFAKPDFPSHLIEINNKHTLHKITVKEVNHG